MEKKFQNYGQAHLEMAIIILETSKQTVKRQLQCEVSLNNFFPCRDNAIFFLIIHASAFLKLKLIL